MVLYDKWQTFYTQTHTHKKHNTHNTHTSYDKHIYIFGRWVTTERAVLDGIIDAVKRSKIFIYLFS